MRLSLPYMKRFCYQLLKEMRAKTYTSHTTVFFQEWFPQSFYKKRLQKEFPQIERIEFSIKGNKVLVDLWMTYSFTIHHETFSFSEKEIWEFHIQNDQLFLHSIQLVA